MEELEPVKGLNGIHIEKEEEVNVGAMKSLDLYLKLSEGCLEAMRQMPTRNFNKEQCGYLVNKLEVAVQVARSFFKVSRSDHCDPDSSWNVTKWVGIFKLLLALGKQVEDFIAECSKSAWVEAAMTLTDVAEYVSTLGFNLELCKALLVEGECAAMQGGLTSVELDNLYKVEVEMVKEKAIVDKEYLLKKVTLASDASDLAKHLLERLRHNPTGDNDKLFDWVKSDSTKQLGKGASATVYEATLFGTPVAQKTFFGPENPFFLKEVKILSQLCHPNITSMFCSTKNKRSCSIIMELMDCDLFTLIQRRCVEHSDSPPFSIFESLNLMLQIGEGVNYLHNKGIIHRDLKSYNILVKMVKAIEFETGYVQAKVVDFGLSKTKEGSATYSQMTYNEGTPRWMAPELVKPGEDDQECLARSEGVLNYKFKCDVYSFAMVCYEILTGDLPFKDEWRPRKIKEMVLMGERPGLPTNCPTTLKALIEKCWIGNAKERPTFATICSTLKYLKYVFMREQRMEMERKVIVEDEAEVRRAKQMKQDEDAKVKTHAFRKAHDNIDGTLEAAQSLLHQFDVSRQVENQVLEGPKSDFDGFLGACDELHKNIEYLTLYRSWKASDTALNQARDLFGKGMSRLEEEFKVLLTSHSKPADPARLMETLPIPGKHVPETPPNGGGEEVKLLLTNTPHNDKALNPPVLPVLISPKVVPQLHEMAQRLVAAGHHQQCLKTYREVRASNLEQSLRILGVERLSKDDIMKMPWELLEVKITNWIQYMRIAIKLLFSTERKLCDQIWVGLDPHREKCFSDVTDSSVHMLLSFGEAIAKSKKSPEKFFVLLDMYETMRDLQPEIEQVFSGDAATGMREAATGLIRKLGQTAKDTFADFEDAVDKDATKTLVLDGTVHMLTGYVMNYVKFLLDYQNTLNELFSVGNVDDKTSHLAAATKRIMKVLQTNLEQKSKLYKDLALAHLFLMNNIHYMVKSVRRSEAKDMLGDDWVQIQRRVVQQHGISYQRQTWSKVLQYITGSGGLFSGDSGISKSQLKERLKGFSLTFEDLYLRQTQWTIPDNDLREAVRVQVQEIILPAYRSFLKRYSAMIEGKQSVNKYFKYNPDDLERMLNDLFEGKSLTASSRSTTFRLGSRSDAGISTPLRPSRQPIRFPHL